MKRGGSKQKGNTFERLIAKKLSLWLTDGVEEYAVWRSDSSGAHSTQLLKLGKNSMHAKKNVGDLVSTSEKGMFPKVDNFFDEYVVELKHYKAIDFYPPFNKILISFFEECLKEKENTGKKIILIVKANNKQILLLSENKFDKEIFFIINYKGLSLYCSLFDDIVAFL